MQYMVKENNYTGILYYVMCVSTIFIDICAKHRQFYLRFSFVEHMLNTFTSHHVLLAERSKRFKEHNVMASPPTPTPALFLEFIYFTLFGERN